MNFASNTERESRGMTGVNLGGVCVCINTEIKGACMCVLCCKMIKEGITVPLPRGLIGGDFTL